jgi:hypothetical protein
MKKFATAAAVLALTGSLAACTVPEEPASSSASTKVTHTAKKKGKKHHKAAAPAEPTMTSDQKNAIESAKDYLDYSAFSRKGLIEQLSSDAGEGYSRADAVFVVNHIDVDWNEQAVKSAKEYLDYDSFSRQGLIEQLSSDAGEGFTRAQAQYAVDKVY